MEADKHQIVMEIADPQLSFPSACSSWDSHSYCIYNTTTKRYTLVNQQYSDLGDYCFLQNTRWNLGRSSSCNLATVPIQLSHLHGRGSNIQERQDKDHYERWPITVKLFYLRTTAEKHSLGNSKEYNMNYWSGQHKFCLNIQLQKKKIIADRRLLPSPEATVTTTVPVLPLSPNSSLAFLEVSHSPLGQNNRNTEVSYLAL